MDFDEMISSYPPETKSIAETLRKWILASNKKITEHILGGKKVQMAYYHIGPYNNAVGVIGPAIDHCKLYLHHTDNIDTGNLKFEGKGKHARHIKLRGINMPDETLCRRVIEAAAAITESKA